MVRRIIVGAVAVVALTLGTASAAAAAGAATTTTPSTTPSSGSTTTTAPVTPSCANLGQLLKRYHASELKVSKWLHHEQATEGRLRKLGHSKLAGFMAKRVHLGQAREKRITARIHQAVRACNGRSGTSKSSTSSTSSPSSTSG